MTSKLRRHQLFRLPLPACVAGSRDQDPGAPADGDGPPDPGGPHGRRGEDMGKDQPQAEIGEGGRHEDLHVPRPPEHSVEHVHGAHQHVEGGHHVNIIDPVADRLHALLAVHEGVQEILPEEKQHGRQGEGDPRRDDQAGNEPGLHPLRLPGPHVLGREGGDRISHLDHGADGDGVDLRRRRVPGDHHGTITIHQSLDEDQAQGDDGLLDGGGDGQTEHPGEEPPVKKLRPLRGLDAPEMPHQNEERQDGGDPLGDEGGPGHARHSHM